MDLIVSRVALTALLCLVCAFVLIRGALSVASDPRVIPSVTPSHPRAQGLYARLCAGCHGVSGRGDGPLAPWLRVAPRDFTRAPFKWRSTPSGTPPLVQDVADTIARGVPGQVMPAFGAALAPSDRNSLAEFVLQMSHTTASPQANAVTAVDLQTLRATTPRAQWLERGAQVYKQLQCGTCHGETLRGDGPSAHLQTPPPYDLTALPARGGSSVEEILRSLRTGLDGTSMPAFEGAAEMRDLAAMAEWIVEQIPLRVRTQRAANDPGRARWAGEEAAMFSVPIPTLQADDLHALRERTLWTLPLAPQGNGPSWLTPVEQSLDPMQCARCHAKQFEQFQHTVHAAAMGPGVLGQLVDMSPEEAQSCQTCHGPLAEQFPQRFVTHPGQEKPLWEANPAYEHDLRDKGVVCAACHLRGRERFGPTPSASSTRLSGVHYPVTHLDRYERGDFCVSCHQHTQNEAVNGTPILNTVQEWLDGPYFARGVQCQHCHMPDRDHTWRGAHDPNTVRQAVQVSTRAVTSQGEVQVEVRVANVGAGHCFPTTTTPAAIMDLEWLDAHDHPVSVALHDVMQRRLRYNGTAWIEEFDTRIRPGAERVWMVRSTNQQVKALRYTLRFDPDEYYRGFYEHEVNAPNRSTQGRAMLQQALAHARASSFTVQTGVVRW